MKSIARDSTALLCSYDCSRNYTLSPQFSVLFIEQMQKAPVFRDGLQYRVQNYSTERPEPLHGNEKPIYVFLFWELRGLSSNFHIHVSESDLHIQYIPRIGPHISRISFMTQSCNSKNSSHCIKGPLYLKIQSCTLSIARDRHY